MRLHRVLCGEPAHQDGQRSRCLAFRAPWRHAPGWRRYIVFICRRRRNRRARREEPADPGPPLDETAEQTPSETITDDPTVDPDTLNLVRKTPKRPPKQEPTPQAVDTAATPPPRVKPSLQLDTDKQLLNTLKQLVTMDPSSPGKMAWLRTGTTTVLVAVEQLRAAVGIELEPLRGGRESHQRCFSFEHLRGRSGGATPARSRTTS